MNVYGKQISQAFLYFVLAYWNTATCFTINVPNPGFDKDQGHLIYVQNNVHYSKAEAVCRRVYHGYLVSTSTPQQKQRVRSFLSRHHLDPDFWIGLQWNANQELVWNDGKCSPLVPWPPDCAHPTNPDSCYVPDIPDVCYRNSDLNSMTYEQHKCDQRPFICQTAKPEFVNMKLTTKTKASDNDSCVDMCYEMTDCFMAADNDEGCIFGLASSTAETYVFRTELEEVVTSLSAAAQLLFGYPLFRINCSNSVTDLLDTSGQSTAHLLDSTPVVLSHSDTVVSSNNDVTDIVTMTSSRIDSTAISTMYTQTANSLNLQDRQTQSSQVVLETSAVSTVTLTVTATMTVTHGVTSDCEVPTLGHIASNVPNISEATEQIVKELTVERTSLSKTTRARTSAENKLTSSVVLGSSVSFIFIGLYAFIFLMDLHKLIVDIKFRLIHNLRQAASDRLSLL